MQYVSTRGHSARKNFSAILTAALAQDGGLYMPDHIDSFTHEEITALKDASYAQLATRILSYFAGDSIACSDVEQAIEKGLKRFTSPQIAPLTKLGGNRWLLELYHGPTLAFKDYALQIVAELINDQLNRTDQQAMVLCATSGDTGAAAAAAFAGRNRVKVVVLHPEGRVSDVQRRQMTTLPDDNILNVAIRGDFDDCQALVKAMFQDSIADDLKLTAVNSINWARIVSQVVYYAWASLQLADKGNPHFVVPTGNFGNILAAQVARKLGFPIGPLTLSSNENDVLPRFFESGHMQRRETLPSLSPSMDIQVSSNFERALWWAMDCDSAALRASQQALAETGEYAVPEDIMTSLREHFNAVRCTKVDAVKEIQRVHKENNLAICPHTATASFASRSIDDSNNPVVVVATAHPAKFPVGVEQALGAVEPLPDDIERALSGEERFITLDADLDQLRQKLIDFS